MAVNTNMSAQYITVRHSSNKIKSHNLNNQIPKKLINVAYAFRDIKCQILLPGIV